MKCAALLFAVVFLCQAGQGQAERQAKGADAGDADLATVKQQILALAKQQQQILDKLNDLQSTLLGRTDALPSTTDIRGEDFKGKTVARVVMIEYGDFECEFCGRFERDTYPQIFKNYVETGNIRFIYRDLPLHHPHALMAARASHCAGDQGRYWEMHDALFANQTNLSEDHIFELVSPIGLDSALFIKCLQDDKFTDAIQVSVSQANALGLRATPSFIIGTLDNDGHTLHIENRIVGAAPYDTFKADLDGLLASATH